MLRVLPLLILPFIWAFNFSPMSQVIEVGENRNGGQFLIDNDGPTNIAVELSVKERKMSETGEETLFATKDVNVFPPQVIIPPGEKRTIRVSLSGIKDLKSEKNYRVIAEQLPLKVDAKVKDQAGIQMLMKFVAALYASPSDAKSDISIISQTSNGKVLQVLVENKGTKHQLLNNPVLKYAHKGTKGDLKTDDLQGLAGENVLAGQKRLFTIKSSVVIPSGAKLDLKFND